MKYNDFDKPTRFSYFLPYGIVSPFGLHLSIDGPACAGTLLDPTLPMEDRIAVCEKEHKTRLAIIASMVKYGYIEKVSREDGKPGPSRIMLYRLTRSGFHVLTGFFDPILEEARMRAAGQNPVRNRNGLSYQWLTEDELDILKSMTLFSQHRRNPINNQWFLGCAETAIESRYASILAIESTKAPDVQLTPSTNADELYRNWRLANVDAMFKANQYLTVIDVLPMSCIIPVYDIYNVSRNKLDIPTYTHYTLDQWYTMHPETKRFTDPFPESEEDTQNTPGFYPLRVIPGFAPFEQIDHYRYRKIGSKTIHHTCIGLATGTKANYVVYHTAPGHTSWKNSLENQSKTMLRRALEDIYRKSPHPHKNKPLEYALMFCPTPNQFEELFESAKESKKSAHTINNPYDAVCIVPINHSGVAQLRLLMESNPITVVERLKYHISKNYSGFSTTLDSTFPLIFNHQPVLLAHTMDFRKLYTATKMYPHGKGLYISCFPEQVKYLQRILPHAIYL